MLDRGVLSILVEGGSKIAGAFVDDRLVDRAAIYVSPRVLGGERALPAVGGLGAGRLSAALALGDLRVDRLGHRRTGASNLLIQSCARE